MLTNSLCPRRRLGKTELSIPVIPFGTQGFGDNFGTVTIDASMELIRRAVDLGVNHFDCARCYGNSIYKLSEALKNTSVRDASTEIAQITGLTRREIYSRAVTLKQKFKEKI